MFCRGAIRSASCVANSLPHSSRFRPLTDLPTRVRLPLHQQSQRRAASTWQIFRKTWRENPFSVTAGLVVIAFSGSVLLYIPFWYEKYQIRPYHNFPEEVAKELRKALYYQEMAAEPKQASRHYKRALQVAEEVGMDPFSAEVLGTKIRFAGFLEQYYNYQTAIKVLGIIRSDCVRWEKEVGHKHYTDGKRTRVLATAVRASVKMGEIYGLPYVGEHDKAEEALTWSVDTALREAKRREAEGEKEGEGEWFNQEEMGGTLESLAHFYEGKGMHKLAAPLFLKALTVCPSGTCHAALLMNNLASAFAADGTSESLLQPKRPSKSVLSFIHPRAPPHGTVQEPPPTSVQLTPSFVHHDSSNGSAPPSDKESQALTPAAQASSWAKMAVSSADAVPAELRNEECDQAKCAALYNLGELAERQGSPDFAVDWYKQAASVAKSIGFDEGVKMSQEGLRRVKS